MDISDSGVHTCIRSTRKAEGGETLSQKLTVVPCILKKSERISLRRGRVSGVTALGQPRAPEI